MGHFNILKLDMPLDSTHMEGTVSQILYLGLSSHFRKSRKMICKN